MTFVDLLFILAAVVSHVRGKKQYHEHTPEQDQSERASDGENEGSFTVAKGKHTFKPSKPSSNCDDPHVQWILEFEEAERQKRVKRLARRSLSR